MSPTRELAQQIDQAMQGFSYYLSNVSSIAVYGGNDGVRYEQEKRSMQKGADVVIATPGRLISHITLGNIDLSKVSFFILDEADRMLDMGFCDDILQIAKQLPEKHQTIMFSATMPKDILQLAHQLLKDPVEVKLSLSKPAEGISQGAYICYETQKLGIVKALFKERKPERVIIFTSSKVKTKDLAISIIRAGYKAKAMHSDLAQSERDNVMYEFRSGKIDILVATDIVARGIDIHRIGRTARAGKNGRSITLVSDKDQQYFARIERFLEKDVEKLPIPKSLGEGPAYNKDLKTKKKFHSKKNGKYKGKAKKKSDSQPKNR